MKQSIRLPIILCLLLSWATAQTQQDRISYNNQELFLSGANLAWLSFARDVGPGPTDFKAFADIMQQMHDHGGNALRWWLHTDGSATPEFDESGLVIGPAEGTIEDLRAVLDLAWEREIGLVLCLWSFDMLRSSNSPELINRCRLLLTDATHTQAYIDRALVPMVEAVKGHPAILAWEIFNEAEGMSDEFGWDFNERVPMTDIQRFVNLCAGAIHRSDAKARVTTGAWSFIVLTDEATRAKTGSQVAHLGPDDQRRIESSFMQKYGVVLKAEEIIAHLRQAAQQANRNYYSDRRLRAAGGDEDGTLDFYSVHYYDWAGAELSPFHHLAARWQLDKPVVVAEFDMRDTFGVMAEDLFETLYQNGYAGALPWSWSDPHFSSPEQMLAAMQEMWENHREDVEVNSTGADWPVPASYALKQNYPNPFNPTTVIRYSLANPQHVTLAVYDLLGRRIEVLVDAERSAGPHEAVFDAHRLANGVYFYQLKAGPFIDQKRMLLLK